MMSPNDSQDPSSYLIELHVRGIIHIQIERLPRWLFPAVSGGSLLWTWLAIR